MNLTELNDHIKEVARMSYQLGLLASFDTLPPALEKRQKYLKRRIRTFREYLARQYKERA